jgi:hypothetical protein
LRCDEKPRWIESEEVFSMHDPTRMALVSVVFAPAMPALAQNSLKELDKGSSTSAQVLAEQLAIGGKL